MAATRILFYTPILHLRIELLNTPPPPEPGADLFQQNINAASCYDPTHLKLLRIVCNPHLKHTALNHMAPAFTIWNHTAPYGTIWQTRLRVGVGKGI
jgi:hypothetical protein